MDSETSSSESEFTEEDHPIAHVVVEEVPNSQNPPKTENEYNPFLSQSQQSSHSDRDPGPSHQVSKPGPSYKDPQPGPSRQDSLPGPSNQDSLPGPSNQDLLPGPSNQRSQSARESPAANFPEQKRRGRPPRSSFQHLRPTRGSQRTKKCPKVLNYESFQNSSFSSLQWSDEDKEQFLIGLNDVGMQNIEGLRCYLPHKTENEIKAQINMWKDLAHKAVVKDLAAGKSINGVEAEKVKNLDYWIKYFKEKNKSSDRSTFVMKHYFEILAEYGEFPTPEECGGTNMREIYRCIHQMVNGLPPSGLSKKSAATFLKCIDNVMERLSNPDLINTLEDYLDDDTEKPDDAKFGKSYNRKGKNGSLKPKDKMVSNPVMNPLNLPKSAMMKVLEDGDEDSD